MLSKIIIFVTRHNSSSATFTRFPVVNCFQKLLSSWHDTTLLIFLAVWCTLWIAFKNYYLRDTTQPQLNGAERDHGCELLSKIIIFVTRHNIATACRFLFLVVNCFQKLLSSWHDTTFAFVLPLAERLWIAFKNYYLRDTTQPFNFDILPAEGCELLSKIIIFVTRHNLIRFWKAWSRVVNCFQKLLSSWHDTTIGIPFW